MIKKDYYLFNIMICNFSTKLHLFPNNFLLLYNENMFG